MKSYISHSVIITLFCLMASWPSFFSPAVATKQADSLDAHVIATVGTRKISRLEVERNIALPLYQLDQQRSQMLLYSTQQLIDAELLRLEAERTGQSVEQLLTSALPEDSRRNPRLLDSAASLAKGTAYSQRRQDIIRSLRRQTPIQISLPQVAEPIMTVSSDDDPSVGSPSAPITIIEFSDFQCPFSKRGAETLKEVRKVYGDKVRVVYRDYPAPNHTYASQAAEAAQCAAAQGQFWTYHDLLFDRQQPGSRWDLVQLAQEALVDLGEFTQCLNNRHYAQEVEHDLRDALSLGITSTPTFFVNGRPIVGARSLDEFKAIIDRALAEHKPTPFPS